VTNGNDRRFSIENDTQGDTDDTISVVQSRNIPRISYTNVSCVFSLDNVVWSEPLSRLFRYLGIFLLSDFIFKNMFVPFQFLANFVRKMI